LDPHAFLAELVPQRLAESQHEGLGAAVDAVERLRRDRYNRGDVDDRPAAPRHKSRRGSVGKPGQRGDIELDHRFHLVDRSNRRDSANHDRKHMR
jgi:hypothetical protein